MTSSSMHPKSTLDALPKSFVTAMRTLFDVMDDKRTGYVRLTDIEKRWHENSSVSRDLPSGVIESLRKVTPANGLLSFERFCAGLRIALLRHDTSRRLESCHPPKSSAVSRPASVPLPERENTGLVLRKPGTPVSKLLHPSNSTERLPMSVLSPPSVNSRMNRHTATVRPNNVNFVQQRAISMPHLRTGVKTYQPPKRDENQAWGSKDIAKRGEPLDKNKVSLALEKWRLMKTYHLPSKSEEPKDIRSLRNIQERNSASFPNLSNEPVSSSDGKNVYVE